MNENERPASNAGEKRSDRRPGGKFDGQRRPYAGKPEGHRPARPQGDQARRDEKRPYGGKPASGPRKFDGERRPQPSGNRSFEKKTDRPCGKPASGKPSFGRPSGKPAYGNRPRKPAAPVQPSARKLALKVLLDVHENGAYAALSLNKTLPRDLKPEERRLTTQLVYGTLENEVKIDHALNQLTEYPARDAVTRDALRLGVFQILFLERVPDSAAVDESVKLVKTMGMEASAGFVNAVLRNLIRQKDELSWPDKEKDPEEWLHVESSTPLWLGKKLIEASGSDCIFDIDSDGYVGTLIPLWIEAGIHVNSPLEVAAHNDINAYRAAYGTEIAFRGGVDKRKIAAGGGELRAEMKRLEPAVNAGGYIPGCDHGVPFDISWQNFVDYCGILARMTGWK